MKGLYITFGFLDTISIKRPKSYILDREELQFRLLFKSSLLTERNILENQNPWDYV